MYRDRGVEKGYEDAIPVKRSRRSERLRSESRIEAANRKTGIDFVLNKTEHATRKIPTAKDVDSAADDTARTNEIAENRITSPRPVRPPVRPKFLAEPVTTAVHETIPDEPASTDIEQPVHAYVSDPIPDEPAKTKTATASSDEVDGVAMLLAEYDESDTAALDDAVAEKESHAESEFIGRDLSDDSGKKVGTLATVSRERSTEPVVRSHRSNKGRLTVGKVIGRFFLSVFTAIVILVVALFGGLYTVANGPSESIRDTLVLSALQASATKWVPGLFLDDAVVDQILTDSQKVNTDVISVDDYTEEQTEEEIKDKWANAIDGMIYEPVKGATFKGYVLLVRDPSRVSVGVATNSFSDSTIGMRIFDMAEKYNAVAAINGGEYPDAGGMGSGGRPIGVTYSQGECVWSDGLRRSFMGFDKDNRLIVREGMTKAQAEALGIRDGVCFKTGKTLITNEDGKVTMYYADNDTGTAQRTAIGQAADGTVILLVTDGRTASSLGATHNDVIDIMVSYGAISAGMLDGGSSSLMYYKDFYDKYGLDKTDLDEYQMKGLINKYKAFTNPRRMPTCFVVASE